MVQQDFRLLCWNRHWGQLVVLVVIDVGVPQGQLYHPIPAALPKDGFLFCAVCEFQLKFDGRHGLAHSLAFDALFAKKFHVEVSLFGYDFWNLCTKGIQVHPWFVDIHVHQSHRRMLLYHYPPVDINAFWHNYLPSLRCVIRSLCLLARLAIALT